MKLGELRQELFDDDDNDDYEVIVDVPDPERSSLSIINDTRSVKSVRWDHQNAEVVLEVE